MGIDTVAGSQAQMIDANLAEMRDKGEAPWSPEALEEDERRLAEFERTRKGVPSEEVKSWMQSWVMPDELSAPKPRKL